MFSQANGKKEKFIVFFDSTRVFIVYKQPAVFTWVNVYIRLCNFKRSSLGCVLKVWTHKLIFLTCDLNSFHHRQVFSNIWNWCKTIEIEKPIETWKICHVHFKNLTTWNFYRFSRTYLHFEKDKQNSFLYFCQNSLLINDLKIRSILFKCFTHMCVSKTYFTLFKFMSRCVLTSRKRKRKNE